LGETIAIKCKNCLSFFQYENKGLKYRVYNLLSYFYILILAGYCFIFQNWILFLSGCLFLGFVKIIFIPLRQIGKSEVKSFSFIKKSE